MGVCVACGRYESLLGRWTVSRKRRDFEKFNDGSHSTSSLTAHGWTLSERKREQRGEENIIEALAVQMPDVFYSEILPKLDLISTLNLAQVSKWYNDAVWSVDGVRSMEAKMEAKIKAASTGYSSEPLYWAASYGNLPAVRALLKSGVDVNVNFNLNCTPLHYAAEHGHTPVVKVLIEAGADVDKKGHCGKHLCTGPPAKVTRQSSRSSSRRAQT